MKIDKELRDALFVITCRMETAKAKPKSYQMKYCQVCLNHFCTCEKELKKIIMDLIK